MKGSDRQYLKSLAHGLTPTVYIGKGGLSDAVVGAVETSLAAHELMKVKFNGLKDEKQEAAAEIATRTDSSLVTIIGNIATFYRPNPDEDERQIVLPGTSSASRDKKEAKKSALPRKSKPAQKAGPRRTSKKD